MGNIYVRKLKILGILATRLYQIKKWRTCIFISIKLEKLFDLGVSSVFPLVNISYMLLFLDLTIKLQNIKHVLPEKIHFWGWHTLLPKVRNDSYTVIHEVSR